jgi:hypothetical protein
VPTHGTQSFLLQFAKVKLMKASVSCFAFSSLVTVLFTISSLGAPLTGSGTLPFPGATGDPPRDNYQAAGAAAGPFTGTWPGAGPNSPAAPAWWGSFSATGAMPHTPPVGAPVIGTARYNFTLTGGYAPGSLPIGTYFQFGDLDNGSASNEKFRLRAFDVAGNPILSSWLDTPFAATATAFPSDMPSYSFSAGVYIFDGSTVPGNPTISVFLKNNVLIGSMDVDRNNTTSAFILGAPKVVPEPCSLFLMLGGMALYIARARRR